MIVVGGTYWLGALSVIQPIAPKHWMDKRWKFPDVGNTMHISCRCLCFCSLCLSLKWWRAVQQLVTADWGQEIRLSRSVFSHFHCLPLILFIQWVSY